MRIEVNCSRNYPIIIEKGCLKDVKKYINDNRKILIISDDMVPQAYWESLKLQFKNCDIKIVKHGENAKSFEIYEDCLRTLLKLNYSRRDLIIALGGGVVGDLAGFVAASYKRGMDFINIPTTTLSQIDSSIGGKVAINVDGIKNCVGAFYQPSLVLIDPEVLKTLSKRHYNNGLVEAIKAGLIGDEYLFNLFEEDNLDIEQIIYRSLLVKKAIVEQDEKEEGIRKILNFGHTFGHAYESYYHLHDYYHGECVALGMMVVLDDEEIKKRLASILHKLDISTSCDANRNEILNLLLNDKKANQDMIDLIKVDKIGEAKIVNMPIKALEKYI